MARSPSTTRFTMMVGRDRIPRGYTRNPKIHGRFESQYVAAIGHSEGDILPRIGPVGHLNGDVFDLILAHLDEAGGNVEAITSSTSATRLPILRTVKREKWCSVARPPEPACCALSSIVPGWKERQLPHGDPRALKGSETRCRSHDAA
jgi:hypothetical protein